VTGATINTNGPIEAGRIMPGMFQGFPAHFQKMAVLRVHDGGVTGTKAKKSGIELLHIIQDRGRFHIMRVTQGFFLYPGLTQGLITQEGDRLDPIT